MKLRLPLLWLSLLGCGHEAAREPSGGPPKGETWLSGEQVAQAKLKIEPVAIHPLTERTVTGGKIAFDDLKVTHVFSPVSGRISKIRADFGQVVRKGDPLAEIESPDLAQAYADLLKADADLQAAEHDVKRQRELAALHAASEALLEQSEDNDRKAQAEMERAKLKMKLLHAPGAGAVEQGFVLRAPIDGKIVGRNVNPGIEVQGMLSSANIANELFTIGETDTVWLLADLYESQLGKAAVGDKVELTTVASPDTFHGVVDYVADVLDPQTRTARLRCVIQNPDRKLKPEMFVTATVQHGERQVIAVPRKAVLKLGDQYLVFVQIGTTDSGLLRFAVRPVTIGTEEAGMVEIREGLKPGDALVTDGAIILSSQV